MLEEKRDLTQYVYAPSITSTEAVGTPSVTSKNRNCEYCGASYKPDNKSQRFCSHPCSSEASKVPVEKRLQDYSEWEGDCLIWQRRVDKDGYGQIHVNGKVEKTHRVAFEVANGRKIKDGKLVMHTCDTPACINPEHLREGTQLDNVRDMMEKGRQLRSKKITPAQVLEIRKDNRTLKVIASDYGLSDSMISLIKNRKYWAWVV